MTGSVDIEAKFRGFECQVQHAHNDAIEERPGHMALRVCTMPDGQPQVLVMISHADGVINCAVLDQARYLSLALLLSEAGAEAAQLAQAAAEATVQ